MLQDVGLLQWNPVVCYDSAWKYLKSEMCLSQPGQTWTKTHQLDDFKGVSDFFQLVRLKDQAKSA